jgi:hypothetical protein
MQQMLLVNGIPFPATIAFQSLIIHPNEAQTVTFTGVGIGDVAADRYVFLAIPYLNGNNSNYSIVSVTIGGVPATIYAQPFNISDFKRGGCALVSALVPTGTTADVVITWEAGAPYYRPWIGVYRVTGLQSATPYDLVVETNGTYSYPRTKSLNVPKDGLAIASCYINPNDSATLTGISQDYLIAPITNASIVGGGNTISSTTSISVTIGAPSGGVVAYPALVMASFR